MDLPTPATGRNSPLFLWSAVLLLAAFAALTAIQFLRRDSFRVDPERQKELMQTSFAETKPLASADWPQWRGPLRDGVSPATGLLTEWSSTGPTKLWEFKFAQEKGTGYSSMAVARGRLFTLVQEGPHETVLCLDAETGVEIWRHAYRALYENSFGNGPRSTPTVDGDLVYTVGSTGILHCLEAFTDKKEGVVRWRKDLLREYNADNLKWGVSFSPLVEGDLLYLNPGGPNGQSLVALDKTTGDLRWQSQNDVAGYSSPLAVDIAGQRQLVFFTEPGLVSVTPGKGEVLWRFPWQTQYGANIATPIVIGNYVFISSGYGKGCSMVQVHKTASGWQATLVYENKNMMTHFSSCVRHKDHIYGFNDSTLACLDIRTGKLAWRERGFEKGTLLLAEGHLWVVHEYGQKIAVVEATPARYAETAAFEFSSKKCWPAPVIANGRLFLRDEEKIACFDVKKW